MHKTKVHLITLGCRLNEAETESWAQEFEEKGLLLSPTIDEADLLVVNSCAVTEEAVKKSRKLIRKIHRKKPNAKLVVSGCYTNIDKDIQQKINGIDLIIQNHTKDKLVDLTIKGLNLQSTPTPDITEPTIFKRGRNRAFIKIQDGCRYRCSFCIVTIARGKERSYKAKDIINKINFFHQQGVQEVVLTGVHIGGYGSDISSTLYELVKKILYYTDIPRIRLASLEPWELHSDFFELFLNERLMPHLHLPLQSGSDTILKRMARRCKTSDFESIVKLAREKIHNFNLTTDIIVGFPGETEEKWQESLSFINKVKFSHIHIFTYSKRDGTKAATMDEQVESAIKKQRSRMLHEVLMKMREQFLTSYIGKELPVLWEKINDDIWTGYSNNFIQIEMNKCNYPSLENKITSTKIVGINPITKRCIGELV